MDCDTNNLALCIKKMVHSSVTIGYQSACDYPMVLGAGILLLLLHIICPPLFALLVSSSPLFLLTGLLLGALLSYSEPCAPVIAEETSQNQQVLSLKSKISIADRSIEESEDVTVVEMRSDSGEVNIKERAPKDNVIDTHLVETNSTFMAAEMVVSAESLKYAQSNVTVEREEHADEISDKVELQEFESRNIETGDSNSQNQYQFGESVSLCWQSADRQDHCLDCESDLTDDSSSPDASMTDIIPMLEELQPLIDLGTGHPSLTSRDNFISSSDDDEDDLEDDDEDEAEEEKKDALEDDDTISDDEDEAEEEKKDDLEDDDTISDDEDEAEEEKKDDGHNQIDSMMELQRAKNILKFELDQRLMDLQAADATQKLKEASRFHVQVSSISTPRGKSFDPSRGSEEVVDLSRVPDSAPSVLLPRQNLFDLPSGQIVDHGSHSDSDVHQEGNDNAELSGSLEIHAGEDVKMEESAVVISDVDVFKVNNGNADLGDDITSFAVLKNVCTTSRANDPVHAGTEQPILCCQSSFEHNVAEPDSIGEVDSLFKCRMDEVLEQSVSESGIGQPLTVKPRDKSLSSDSRIHAIGPNSVEELNSQFSQPSEEALTCGISTDEHASKLPAEGESVDQQTV